MITILVIFCFIYITKTNKHNKLYFYNIKQFQNYSYSNQKNKLIKLNFKDISTRFNIIKKRNLLLFPMKTVWKYEKYLTSLSKFLDYKIVNSKTKYRSKNNICFIEQVSNYASKQIFYSQKANVFYTYKSIANQTKILIKEQKVFKFVLSYYLFERLFEIEKELSKIEKIISKSKSTKVIKKYKNKIEYSAQIYSILKYNPSSTKLLMQKYTKESTSFFLRYLYLREKNIKQIVYYLKLMYD